MGEDKSTAEDHSYRSHWSLAEPWQRTLPGLHVLRLVLLHNTTWLFGLVGNILDCINHRVNHCWALLVLRLVTVTDG